MSSPFDQKKRKVGDSSGGVLSSQVVPVQRKKRIKLAAASSAAATTSLSMFAAKKASMLQQAFEEVNEELQKALPKCQTPTQRYNLVAFSLAMVQQAKQLYGRTPGTLIAMGSDDMNQLALSSDPDADKANEYYPTECRNVPADNIVQASAGGVHSVALTNDGIVYTWGVNDDGSLAREATGPLGEVIPTQVTEGFDPIDKDQIVSVDTGDAHTVCLSINGNVYSGGMMKDCDSGKFRDPPADGDPNDVEGINTKLTKVNGFPGKVRMLKAGGAFNAALLGDGTVVTWGMGHSGELARSRVMTELTSDEQNPGKMKYDLGKDFFTTVKKVFDQETKKSFEKLVPIRGKIKEHFLTPKPVLWSTPGKRQVISIGCGGFHLIVVAREPGHFETTVWTSGLNQYGQLGLGDTERRDELTLVKALDGKQIIAVDGGNHHSIAMDIHRQQIYAWGRADYGQLGLFADEQEFGEFVTTPRSVPLPDTFDMATERLEEISTGELCSYATTTAGNLYSWGFNESKQTGHKGEGDVQRPRLLKPLERGAKKFKTKTHQISGGSQHSLLVATKYLG